MTTQQTQTDWRDSPTAWFAVLERAHQDGDHERAAEAIRELRRLGVAVRFAPPRRMEGSQR